MILPSKLNSQKYLREKQSALIIARRAATPAEQEEINIKLTFIYDLIYKLLKEQNKCKK